MNRHWLLTIESSISKAKHISDQSKQLGLTPAITKTLGEFISESERVLVELSDGQVKENYIYALKETIESFVSGLPTPNEIDNAFSRKPDARLVNVVRKKVEATRYNLVDQLNQLKFKADFFRKINFFSSNVVAVGANGSGKTFLSELFKQNLRSHGVVISAQRILNIPIVNTLQNPALTDKEIRNSQITKKDGRGDFPNILVSEFGQLINGLVGDSFLSNENFRKEALAAFDEKRLVKPPVTKMDRVAEIWNSLISHRKLTCTDGMNFSAEGEGVKQYPATHLSDGEKVIIYLVSQALFAPKDGFILVDEPEIYLHKSILGKLWDKLESERSDCIFIYLTHDLDFASARYGAEKLWIKSYKHPGEWEIENIPENSIPEPMLLRILGSRKDVLFCEGDEGGLDHTIYASLFPGLTVIPSGSCLDVINNTKAYKKIASAANTAYGIVDSDHQPSERAGSLEKKGIFTLKASEVENLLLEESVISKIKERLANDINIEKIKKRVIKKLNDDFESLVARYVSQKVDYFVKSEAVAMGGTIQDVEYNFREVVSKVNIGSWAEEKRKEITEVIISENYVECLKIYNNKGLPAEVGGMLQTKRYKDIAIDVIKKSHDKKESFEKFFPETMHVFFD